MARAGKQSERESSARPAGKAAPEGDLLAITADGIVGWARDPTRPTEPVRVILLANDEPVATAIANGFDHPVVRARVGPGVGGFAIRLSSLPRGGFPMRLLLRDAAGHPLGTPLLVRDPAALLQAIGTQARGDIEGMVDGLQAGTLIGWALHRTDSRATLEIEVHDGPDLLARTVADQFRPDLLAAGKRDGRCGFVVDLPAALLDGRTHSLRVLVAGTRTELPNSPISFGPGFAKGVVDELARLRADVDRLSARVADLLSPAGELQREIVRALAERVAAIAEVQRDLVERELDALRRIALDPGAVGSESLAAETRDPTAAAPKRRR